MRTSTKPWYRKERKAWYVELNGKQVRLSADKAEARRKWLQLMSEGDAPRDHRLDECVAHYLPTLAPKTRRTREQILNAFMKHVGRIRISKFTKQHVRGFLKPTWSPSTRRS